MRDFTKGNPIRLILLFTLPMLVGNLFQQVYSMTDFVIVGRAVGGHALGAIGSTIPVVNLLIGIVIGLTTGASIVLSQYFGAGMHEDIPRIVSTSMIFVLVFSLLVSAIGLLFTDFFLHLLAIPDSIYEMAKSYYQIVFLGIVFPVLYNMFTAYMRALGDAKSPLIILILASLLNVVLDIWFVMGLDLGVAGAAWATMIAQALSCLGCLLIINRNMPLLQMRSWTFDREIFRPIMNYGLPAALQFSLVSLASLAIMRLINSFGAVAIAAYTAAIKLDMLAIMPLQNASMATATFVGQNMGAGLEKRAKQGLSAALIIMISIGAFFSILLNLFGATLISFFVNSADVNAAAIIDIGSRYLGISAMFYAVFGVFFSFTGFFRGVGDGIVATVMSLISLTIRTFCAYWFHAQFAMGTLSVAWSVPIGWGISAIFAYVYFRSNRWRGKAAIQKQTAEEL